MLYGKSPFGHHARTHLRMQKTKVRDWTVHARVCTTYTYIMGPRAFSHPTVCCRVRGAGSVVKWTQERRTGLQYKDQSDG